MANKQAKINTELESRHKNIANRIRAERLVPVRDYDNYPLVMDCECSNVNCITKLSLPIKERQSLRQNDRQFIIAPGHEDLSLEQVVLQTPNYLVVEKFTLNN